MSPQGRKGGAEDQNQMEDQAPFREDPRGGQEVSEQQPETQPGAGDSDRRPRDHGDSEQGESGRDDPGQATGNPPNAG